MPSSRYERAARNAGYRAIAGVDEAGRGALFGPVFAAAVVLDPTRPIRGLDDSKMLAPERRATLAARIRERAIAWSVGSADAFEIDSVNILEAARLSMQRAVLGLTKCDYLLVDAIRVSVPIPQKPIIHGDALSFSIAAASILAKTARDQAMEAWHQVFPDYGLASNKGYSTPDHIASTGTLRPDLASPVQLLTRSRACTRRHLVRLSSTENSPTNGVVRMSLTPDPAPPAVEESTAPLKRRNWLLILCFSVFSFEIGLFLIVFPWLDNWSLNYFPGAYPFIEDLWEEPAFRGALMGLGFLNIYVSISQLMRLFRR